MDYSDSKAIVLNAAVIGGLAAVMGATRYLGSSGPYGLIEPIWAFMGTLGPYGLIGAMTCNLALVTCNLAPAG